MNNERYIVDEETLDLLAEMRNYAAQVAEMQMDDDARYEIYDLLGEVSMRFNLPEAFVHEQEVEGDEDTPARVETVYPAQKSNRPNFTVIQGGLTESKVG